MASSVGVQPMGADELRQAVMTDGGVAAPEGVLVYTIEGPLFFAAVENFEQALSVTHTDPRVLVICLRRVPFMDVTGLQVLEDVIVQLRSRGVQVLLAEANARVQGKLLKARIIDLVGPQGVFDTLSRALTAAGTLQGQAMPQAAA